MSKSEYILLGCIAAGCLGAWLETKGHFGGRR